MDVVVARLGRPQGLRGELTVEIRTDEPELRLAVGSVLSTRAADLTPPPAGLPATLCIDRAREQSGRLVLGFAGITDRTAAETLRNLLLVVEVDPEQRPADPEEFYDHQLVGLAAVTLDGTPLGTVAEVLHLPAQDVLSLRTPTGGELLVPFVAEIVPTVDLAAGRVTVDPPAGLLPSDDNESDHNESDEGAR